MTNVAGSSGGCARWPGQLAEIRDMLLREDWLDLLSAIRARGMRCTMVTGGRGFSADRARAARDAGLQSVSVSVDGTPGSHDLLRGVRGSFDAALGAIAHAREAGLQATANTQIGRANVRDVL